MSSMHIVLGSHLFPIKLLQEKLSDAKLTCDTLFMCESQDLAQHFCYHKLKIHFFFTSMRRYSLELQLHWPVNYYDYDTTSRQKMSFFDCLETHITENKISQLSCFYPEDRFFYQSLLHLCAHLEIELLLLNSPLFLNMPADFAEYLTTTKKPFLKTYYEQQRRQRDILMDGKNPAGGHFSYDQNNRKKIPENLPVPKVKTSWDTSLQSDQVKSLIEQQFSGHPGELSQQWYATSTAEARELLQAFLKERFTYFGDYQDALNQENPFSFHSVLSPYINSGLLPVQEVIDSTLEYARKNKVPLNSLEGFIRQIIGWREFVFGIDQHYGEQQAQSNFFKHTRSLTQSWYTGTTGLAPLDKAIRKALKYAYNHHIERLMIIGNIMLLCEIHPQKAYAWFMEFFIDSADWVMGPNVYGMGLFADGGIFATKPYICGSNYLIKMGYTSGGQWQDILDGLYWRFIAKHRDYFQSQPRLSMMARQLDRLKEERLHKIFAAAEQFLQKNTVIE